MLGQRARRIVLRQPEERTRPPHGVPDTEEGKGGHCPLHRTNLQSTADSLRTRLPDTTRGPQRVPEFTARSIEGRKVSSPESARQPRAAEADLNAAEDTNRATPARLPLGDVNPGQQILEIQTKLLTHAVKIAAYNTATALARNLRIHTGYARANHEAHALIRQVLTHSGDIDPDPEAGTLTVRLDPLPTARATRAVAELCEHLTHTQTRYPGTDLVLRYGIKPRR